MTEKRKPHLYDFFRVHLVYDSFTDLWWVHLYEVSQNAPQFPVASDWSRYRWLAKRRATALKKDLLRKRKNEKKRLARASVPEEYYI